MNLPLNTNPTHDNIAYTFIEWNDNDTDTIRSKVYRGDGYLISKMFAFNDSIWSNPDPIDEKDFYYYIYTIVK